MASSWKHKLDLRPEENEINFAGIASGFGGSLAQCHCWMDVQRDARGFCEWRISSVCWLTKLDKKESSQSHKNSCVISDLRLIIHTGSLV